MKIPTSPDIFWLTLTIIMTSLFWVPYIVNRLHEQGFLTALWDPQGITKTKRAWAQRMMQAHENAVENLVVFAPLVILVQLSGLNSDTTAKICLTYFVARLLHYIVFTFAIPVLRVVTFVTGFLMQLTLGVILIGSM